MTADTGSASAPAAIAQPDAPRPHPSKMPSLLSPQAPAATMNSPAKIAQTLMDRHGDWLKSASLSDWVSKHRGAITGAALGGATGGALAYAIDKARGPDPSDPDAPFWMRRPPVWLHALNGAMAGSILGSMEDDNRRAREVLDYVREATEHMRQQQKRASDTSPFMSRHGGKVIGALTGAAGGALSGAAAGAYAQRQDPAKNPNAVRNGVLTGLVSGAALGGIAGHGLSGRPKAPLAIPSGAATSSWYDTSRHPEKLRRVWDTVINSSELQDPAAAQRARTFLTQVGTPGADVSYLEGLRNSFPQDSQTRQLFGILMNNHAKTAAFDDTLRSYGLVRFHEDTESDMNRSELLRALGQEPVKLAFDARAALQSPALRAALGATAGAGLGGAAGYAAGGMGSEGLSEDELAARRLRSALAGAGVGGAVGGGLGYFLGRGRPAGGIPGGPGPDAPAGVPVTNPSGPAGSAGAAAARALPAPAEAPFAPPTAPPAVPVPVSPEYGSEEWQAMMGDRMGAAKFASVLARYSRAR